MIVGADVYAAPGLVMNIFLTSLNPDVSNSPIEAIAVARSLATPAFGIGILIVGAVPKPIPPSMRLNLTIPLLEVLIEQVAAAPLPPPPVMVIVGASVYPKPVCVINIFSTDFIPALSVVIATAFASEKSALLGEVVIATVGVLVYP